MSALATAVDSLIKAAQLDAAEVNFIRVDNRRRTVQFVTRRGSLRFDLDPAPAKKSTAKKAAAKKTTAAKRPAKKAAAKKAAKKST